MHCSLRARVFRMKRLLKKNNHGDSRESLLGKKIGIELRLLWHNLGVYNCDLLCNNCISSQGSMFYCSMETLGRNIPSSGWIWRQSTDSLSISKSTDAPCVALHQPVREAQSYYCHRADYCKSQLLSYQLRHWSSKQRDLLAKKDKTLSKTRHLSFFSLCLSVSVSLSSCVCICMRM